MPSAAAPLSMTPRTYRQLNKPLRVEYTGTRYGVTGVVLRRLLAAPVAEEAVLQNRQKFRVLALDDLVHLQRAGVDAEPALLASRTQRSPTISAESV